MELKIFSGSANPALAVEIGSYLGLKVGEQLLRARRLCEAGCGFVTVQHGGWDMHARIKAGMQQRGPELDRVLRAIDVSLSLVVN